MMKGRRRLFLITIVAALVLTAMPAWALVAPWTGTTMEELITSITYMEMK